MAATGPAPLLAHVPRGTTTPDQHRGQNAAREGRGGAPLRTAPPSGPAVCPGRAPVTPGLCGKGRRERGLVSPGEARRTRSELPHSSSTGRKQQRTAAGEARQYRHHSQTGNRRHLGPKRAGRAPVTSPGGPEASGSRTPRAAVRLRLAPQGRLTAGKPLTSREAADVGGAARQAPRPQPLEPPPPAEEKARGGPHASPAIRRRAVGRAGGVSLGIDVTAARRGRRGAAEAAAGRGSWRELRNKRGSRAPAPPARGAGSRQR
ncbi:sterile alpha motif domain-containing protein 1-like [Grus americana]|uniref:sterile alpha motif domain-containing protein 1-like n=1 Tax=Grus americana TaxID=9117 RepID=UPI0024087D8E|nr:sterile alpha motif domain-containing protein 1-like [Grus americana]